MNAARLAAMRAVALAGVAATALAAAMAQTSPVAEALREGTPFTGILFGTDFVDHARHSDTLMWWRYDPAGGRLDVLSIPRDTEVDVPGYRFHRINEVFPYHFSRTQSYAKAATALRAAVARRLDVEGTALSPQYYLHVDYEAFRKFVDLTGGFRVHVDEPMHYDDEAGNLHIHYDPGDYLLNGEQALEYVRFRGKSGDRGRVLRQMDFLRSLLNETTSPVLFLRWPRLVAVVAQGFHSNVSLPGLVFMALEAKHLRPERITPALLPGHPRGAAWDVDESRLAFMMAQWGGRPVDGPPPVAGALARKITVKVRNGTRRPGLALSAARRLRAAGFDVLDWGDYNGHQMKTRVLDRAGAIENAQKVAQTLGADSVMSDVDPALRTDVEAVLGDDYRE